MSGMGPLPQHSPCHAASSKRPQAPSPRRTVHTQRGLQKTPPTREAASPTGLRQRKERSHVGQGSGEAAQFKNEWIINKRGRNMSTKVPFLPPMPQLERQTETDISNYRTKTVAYRGKMRCWNQRNGEITTGPTFRHGFPAEDGVKPGLEGWESFEKPEKILGKVVTWGRQLSSYIGGISPGWKCPGSGV